MEGSENKRNGRYLVFADPRFKIEALKELKRLFPNAHAERQGKGKDGIFIAEEVKETEDASFIDFVLRIEAEKIFTGYDDAASAIEGILKMQLEKSFRLEAKKYGTSIADSAKDIEVKLGSMLESKGFHADLENPDIIIYAVFIGKNLFVGKKSTGKQHAYALDAFRYSNKSACMTINRAEFKIKEAIDFFNIDCKSMHKVLDIGAAPGGWTHYLSKYAKIVAVDNALLDYKELNERILVIAEGGMAKELKKLEKGFKNVKVAATAQEGIENFGIVHIKASQKASMPLIEKMGKFDMLCIDINASAEESAGIAESLYGCMNANAVLIMTIKLVTMEVERHINTAREKLAHYSSIKIKKLPHNRREVTLFAVANTQ